MVIAKHIGLFFLVIAVCGCGSEKPATVKVSGTVTYKGEPVEGATVVFGSTSAGGRAAAGTTDSAGKFSLTTFEKDDGAIPGSYTVAISKTETVGGMTADEEHAAISAGKEVRKAETIHKLPEKYSNGLESGLKAEVKADGTNDFKFELTD